MTRVNCICKYMEKLVNAAKEMSISLAENKQINTKLIKRKLKVFRVHVCREIRRIDNFQKRQHCQY